MQHLKRLLSKLRDTFTHIPKPTMSNKYLLTIIGCVILVSASLAIPPLLAKPDEKALTNARIQQLTRELADNSAQYAKLEPEMARNQERCSLAQEEARQLTTLNASNNSKRRELQFLQSLLGESVPK